MKIFYTICCLALISLLGGCKKSLPVRCEDKMKDVKVESQNIGASFTINCPSGCTGGTAWGTDTYTIDSPFCKAAIHAGIITAAKGGDVKISIVKSLPSYKGSDRNGIQTNDWSSSWGDKAYTLSK